MTNEQRLDNFDQRLHDIDKRQESFESFMKAFIQKSDQSLADQRERMNRLEDKHDADMKELRADNKATQLKLDEINKSIHNITLTAMAGIGAMAISVIAFVAVTLYRG